MGAHSANKSRKVAALICGRVNRARECQVKRARLSYWDDVWSDQNSLSLRATCVAWSSS